MRMQFARYTLWKTVHDKQPVSAVRKTRVREGDRKRNYRLKIEQINKTKKKKRHTNQLQFMHFSWIVI